MSLRLRLTLLIVLLSTLPAVVAVLVTRQLVGQSLELGLSDDLDAALEAGLRRSAELYRQERAALALELQAWATTHVDLNSPEGLRTGDRLLLRRPGNDERVLRAGELEPSPQTHSGEAPDRLRAEYALADGATLVLERALDPDWRADAVLLQETLQRTRLLRTERTALERSFWLPFAGIYALTLLLGFAGALWITRGLTRPVGQLVALTERVREGDWQTRAATNGPREIASLALAFNQMLERIEAQHRSLVDLEKMAGWREMARTLAHEVKNPLTPIQLTVEEMGKRYRGDDAQYRELLNECTRIVVEEVQSLRNVVERFREFSRPVELKPEPVNLHALLADVAVLQKDLHVTTEFDPAIETIRADADRLRQLCFNLTENARQALAGQPQPSLVISTRRAADVVHLRFADNGPGIAPAERERIFEPYRSGRSGGLGLGLALAKGIVLAHGGTIRAEAPPNGIGAILHVELPLDGPSRDFTAHATGPMLRP